MYAGAVEERWKGGKGFDWLLRRKKGFDWLLSMDDVVGLQVVGTTLRQVTASAEGICVIDRRHPRRHAIHKRRGRSNQSSDRSIGSHLYP